MKATITAHELTNAAITKVSLVKHGANRMPFQIIKADLTAVDTSGSLRERLAKAFSKPEQAPKVTAVFVQKDAFPALRDTIAKAGFRVEKDHAELIDDVVVLKQDGYGSGDKIGSMLALSPEVGLGFDTVVKSFCSWHASQNFDETLQSQAFYPSVRIASEALAETLYAIMGSADTAEEAAGKVEEAVKAFGTYIVGLSKVLPAAVFKMEQELPVEFGAPTVQSAEGNQTVTKGDTMKGNQNLREVVKGDLDGLFNAEQESASVVKTSDASADAGAETGDTAANAADANADAGATAGAGTDQTAQSGDNAEAAANAAADNAAAADGAGPAVKADANAEGIAAILKSLSTMASVVQGMSERLDAVEKAQKDTAEVAKSAAAAVGNTAIVQAVADIDESLGRLAHHRSVEKTDVATGVSKSGSVYGDIPGLQF